MDASSDPDASDADRIEEAVFAALESDDPDAALQAMGLPSELQTRAFRVLARLRSEQLIDGSGDRIPEILGEFRLGRRLGAGGMGVVYLATQQTLGRTVALKLVRPENLFFPGSRERFRREVEAVARLQHPSIVTVYTAGEEAGLPYYCMEYLAGCSLADALAELQGREPEELRGVDLQRLCARRSGDGKWLAELPAAGSGVFEGSWADACVAIAVRVTDALQHAHARGILHRDVKPSNILLTPDGRARLADFGLAWTESATSVTGTHTQIGSLPYLPPENLDGAAVASPQQDVYAVGVTLYEMLALANPFAAATAAEIKRRIVEANPARLRGVNPSVSWELETVCMAALDADVHRRYPGAAALLHDLENVRHRRPISARRPGPVLRLRRFAERHRTAAVATAVALVLLLVGSLVYGWREARARLRADQLTARALADAYAAAVQSASYALSAAMANPTAARELLQGCPPELRRWEWRHLALDADAVTAHVGVGPGDLRTVAWQADGSRLVLAATSELRVVDVASGAVVKTLDGIANGNGALALRADRCAHGEGMGGIALRSLPDGELQFVLADDRAHARPVTRLVFTADGAGLLSSGGEGNVALWSLAERRLVRVLHRHAGVVRGLCLAADGRSLASSGLDRRVVMWDLEGDRLRWERTTDGYAYDVAFEPAAARVWACDGRAVAVFDTASGEPSATLRHGLDRLAFAPAGDLVAGLLNRQRVMVFEIGEDGSVREIASLVAADANLHGLAFAADGSRLAAVGSGPAAHVWEPRRRAARRHLWGHGKAVTAVCVVSGAVGISGDSGGGLRWIDLDAGTSRPAKRRHAGRVRGLAAAADGRTVLSAAETGEIWLWDGAGEQLARELDSDGEMITCAAIAGDASRVAAATPGGKVLVWDATGAAPVQRLSAGETFVTCVAFRPDRPWLAAGTETGEVVEWDVASGRERRRLPAAGSAWVAALCYGPEGAWLAAAASDCAIRVYRDGEASPWRELAGHTRTPSALAVTADGRLVSAGGFEFAVKIWDVAAGRCLLWLNPINAALALAAAPNGDRLLTGHLRGDVQVWDAARELRPAAVSEVDHQDRLTPPPSSVFGARHR